MRICMQQVAESDWLVVPSVKDAAHKWENAAAYGDTVISP